MYRSYNHRLHTSRARDKDVTEARRHGPPILTEAQRSLGSLAQSRSRPAANHTHENFPVRQPRQNAQCALTGWPCGLCRALGKSDIDPARRR